MNIEAELIQAPQEAIPGFQGDAPSTQLPLDDADAALGWMEELLGKRFHRHVEWKEFSSWGFDRVV